MAVMSAALSSTQFGGLMRVAEHAQNHVMQGNLLRVASREPRERWLFQTAMGEHMGGGNERTQPMPVHDY